MGTMISSPNGWYYYHEHGWTDNSNSRRRVSDHPAGYYSPNGEYYSQPMDIGYCPPSGEPGYVWCCGVYGCSLLHLPWTWYFFGSIGALLVGAMVHNMVTRGAADRMIAEGRRVEMTVLQHHAQATPVQVQAASVQAAGGFCGSCGAKRSGAGKFCTACGADLSGGAEAS